MKHILNRKNLVTFLYFFAFSFTAMSSWSAEEHKKQLIVIDGPSGMGKSSTADALKVWFESNTNKKIARSSIDHFFKATLFADHVQKNLKYSYLQWCGSWHDVKAFMKQSQKSEFDEEYFSYIDDFFTNIRPMHPNRVFGLSMNYMEPFYEDIKQSLRTADVVIVDHRIALGYEKPELWSSFVRSISDIANVTVIGLNCDYENFKARNKKRNESKNLNDHRYDDNRTEAQFARGSAYETEQRIAACAREGIELYQIDSSDKAIDLVVEEIVKVLPSC